LATKKVALTDLDDIDLYDDALEAVMPDAGEVWVRTIGELRWQAVKTLPKQEELGLKSFKACLSEHDLEHAQQVLCCRFQRYLIHYSTSLLSIRSENADYCMM
jgi:N-terminal acetyltransferase B complex non-catalytic subunit